MITLAIQLKTLLTECAGMINIFEIRLLCMMSKLLANLVAFGMAMIALSMEVTQFSGFVVHSAVMFVYCYTLDSLWVDVHSQFYSQQEQQYV